MQTHQQRQFAALVVTNQRFIFKIINAHFQDQTYHDDIFQDIVIRAWSAYDRFRGDCPFQQWIGKIAKNTIIDRLRRMGTQVKLVSLNNALYEIVDEPYFERDFPVIDTLSEKEKQTLQMRIDGFSFEYISEHMGEPVNRLMTRMHRIKQRLSKSVKS